MSVFGRMISGYEAFAGMDQGAAEDPETDHVKSGKLVYSSPSRRQDSTK